MRNKLFWIVVVVLSVLAICLLLVQIYAQDKATWVIAIFTTVLAITTIWNAKVTQGLLDHSRKELKESRIVWLIGMVERTIDYLSPLGSSKVKAAAQYVYSKIMLIGKIEDISPEEFLEHLKSWAAGVQERGNTIPSQIIGEVEKLLKERKVQ